MNNNKQQRLDKLTAEYNDLNGKISRLDAFLNRLDFETTVPDTQEQMLMQHQLQAMRSYRTNLKERIQLLQVQIQAGSPCDDRVVTSAAHHCGQDTRHRDEAAKKLCALLVKGRMAVYAPGKKCNKCGGNLFEGIGTEEGGEIICFNCANQITNEELQQALDEYRAACLNHCGQDAVNFEQLSDNLTDTYKDYCRGVLEQFLSREITWAKFVEKVALPFCHENVNEFVNVIKDNPHNCRPGREKCQVGGGSAVVNETPDSLKSLEGMQVIKVCGPKCKDCPCGDGLREYPSGRDMSSCVKVELVGGYYLCLAPLPNSIVTE